MIDYDARTMDRLTKAILFREWRQLIDAGYLTEDGMWAVRARVAGETNEFVNDTDRKAMFLYVSDRLADRLGLEWSDMPGAPICPDTPEFINDAEFGGNPI